MLSSTINKLSEINLITQQFDTQIDYYYSKAEIYFKRSFARPQIKLNIRGSNAGTATPQKNLLRFNLTLYQNNKQHFLQQTTAHEVAHLIAYTVFGLDIKPHGKEWQHIMQQVFQKPAERCHNYLVSTVQKRHYLYQCQCTNITHTLSSRRHSFIRKGYQYICKYCKKSLIFTGQSNYQ